MCHAGRLLRKLGALNFKGQRFRSDRTAQFAPTRRKDQGFFRCNGYSGTTSLIDWSPVRTITLRFMVSGRSLRPVQNKCCSPGQKMRKSCPGCRSPSPQELDPGCGPMIREWGVVHFDARAAIQIQSDQLSLNWNLDSAGFRCRCRDKRCRFASLFAPARGPRPVLIGVSGHICRSDSR